MKMGRIYRKKENPGPIANIINGKKARTQPGTILGIFTKKKGRMNKNHIKYRVRDINNRKYEIYKIENDEIVGVKVHKKKLRV